MSEKILLVQITDTQDHDQENPEVKALMARLNDMEPQDLAEALFNIEAQEKFPQLFTKSTPVPMDQGKLFFSRGVKNEIESIYLELAHHLREKTPGSTDLMNEVFDFLNKALSSLVRTNILSMN